MNISRTLAWLMLAGILIAPAAAQAPRGAQGQRAARSTDGKPNLNGIWQALGTANWEIQDHPAYSGPMWELGAIGAVPAGQGVVEGNEIPYRPEALAKKKENFKNRRTLDPEAKCYMPGIPRATYMPYPFQIVQTPKDILMVYEYATASRLIRDNGPPLPTSPCNVPQVLGHARFLPMKNSLKGNVRRRPVQRPTANNSRRQIRR